MTLLTIDIGGTTIKYALAKGNLLSNQGVVATPKTLEEFYATLESVVSQYRKKFEISGVAISSPGAVNKKSGVIEGASALPYIHKFDIHSEFESRFGLPVSIENDANCAALAEVEYGSAKGLENVLLCILGTGFGGSVVVNGKIHHGKHLFGGEFGFMLMDEEHSLSNLGTTVEMAKRYNKRTKQELTGKEVFEQADSGDEIAQEEKEIFTFNVAKAIYNLQYSFDPDLILIGGGVSQADWLLSALREQMEKIKDKLELPPFIPDIAQCKFKNEANLIGAAVDFNQTFRK